MAIEVTREVLDALRAAATRAQPFEACGILFGKGARITRFVEASNVHPEPMTHFEINPQALINAHREERSGGPKLLGYFHSHPKGQAKPSKTDQEMAPGDGKLWAIMGECEIAFWQDQPGGFQSLCYGLIDD